MKLEIETETLYDRDKTCVVEVSINSVKVRVYIGEEWLEVRPYGTVKRTSFKWDDWIFENLDGGVFSAATICALAVCLDPNADLARQILNEEILEPLMMCPFCTASTDRPLEEGWTLSFWDSRKGKLRREPVCGKCSPAYLSKSVTGGDPILRKEPIL